MLVIFVGALVVGLLLGLMGSGGSIVTVPVLVYLLGHDGKVAIAESLAIVGGIALATMLPFAHSKLVSWRNVLFFGIPGMAGTYLGAWLSNYVAGAVQLLVFAVVMLIAAVVMFRNNLARGDDREEAADDTKDDQSSNRPEDAEDAGPPKAFWVIGLEGVAVGVVTGLVGVGGGFLIVPALVVFGKLPMRVAIGTSLVVIAMKSLTGFYKYLDVLNSLDASVDWTTVGTFVVVGIGGSLAGHRLATKLNQEVLRQAFAVFLVAMGLFVLGSEGWKMIDQRGENASAYPARPTHATSITPVANARRGPS